MTIRNQVLLLLAAAMVVALNPCVSTAAIIPTNFGNGADAEVRESQTSVGLSGVPEGNNRGNNEELASRLADTTTMATGDRSSVAYMKFDISGLPTDDAFWNSQTVRFRTFVRQDGNFSNLSGSNPSDPAETVNLKFRIRALEPGGTYIEDDPNAANRVDRLGNSYMADQYRYDWNEGTGDAGSGITFYNAPGITPHCMLQGSCGPDPSNVVQTLGIYDDFNADTRFLGQVTPINFAQPGENTLAAGTAIDFNDPIGALEQLIRDAQAAGRNTVTLMMYHGLDGVVHDPPRIGTTPNGMLGRNYVFTPKERMTVIDPDDNAFGAFSPQLIIVPEPSSLLLVALICLAGLVPLRRKSL